MRVLFVAPYAPSRLRIRPYGFVRHLAHEHDVHVLALCIGGLSAPALRDVGELRRQGISVTLVQEARYLPYLRTLKSALIPQGGRTPLQVAYTASATMRAAIAWELRARWYDVVHVEHVRGLGALPGEIAAPVVWDAVDCVSLLYEESLRHAATPMLRTVGRLEARRLRAFERQQVGHFAHALVTSERDRQALLSLAGIPDGDGDGARMGIEITVLPHGIDPRQFCPRAGAARQPETLIFSGRMDYHANIAGALTLARSIMPLIWRRRPQTRLIIAGSNPSHAVRQLARDARITVTGYVRDLNALVSAASVAVCPLPYAVGIQNKVLEAMASGTPVVASAAAAGGLCATPGRDLLVADTAEEFADATLRLLDDPAVWRSVAESGARYVAEHHDWDTITRRLTAVYERALATSSRSQRVAGELAGLAAG